MNRRWNTEDTATISTILKTRKRKLNFFSSNWLIIDKQGNCICRKTYRKTDPSMIQCENCLEWYHFPCIIRDNNSLECITTTSSENITFLCGLKECVCLFYLILYVPSAIFQS